jgi:hypothetical protein
MTSSQRYRKFVRDQRSEVYKDNLGKQWRVQLETRNVEVRLVSGGVYRCTDEITEADYDHVKINKLVEALSESNVHERSAEEMDKDPLFEKSDNTIWVDCNHSGQWGGGKWSYRAIASSVDDLREWGKSLLGNYHPSGYGTSISEPRKIEEGLWIMSASRWGSCD